MLTSAYDISDIAEVAGAALCPLVFAAVVSFLVGLFVFGPLYSRAAWTPPKLSFRIADILILIAQIQVAGGIVYALGWWWRLADDPPFRMAATVLTWALVGFWWWTGVRMLAKARVARSPHRLLFLAVMVPIGYLCALGVVLTPIIGVSCFSLLCWMIIEGDPSQIPLVLLLVALNVAIIGGLFGVRRYARLIVERARDDVALGDGIAFGPLHRLGVPIIHQPMATDGEVQFDEEQSPSSAATDAETADDDATVIPGQPQ